MLTRSTTPPPNRRYGAAAVELAMLLPFIVFLCVLTADWARIYHMTLTANACARNGALYASDDSYAAQSPYDNYTEAALAEAPQLSTTPTVSKTTTTDSAGNSAVLVTVTITFDTITSFPGVPKSTTVSRSCQMRIAPLTTD